MGKKCCCVLISFLILLAACAPEQALPVSPTVTPGPARTWIKTFAGDAYGAFFDISLTGDRHAVVVGATNHRHVAPYSGDALFIKLTLAGEVLWEATWGGEGYEQAVAVEEAADGRLYVFGETGSHGAGDRDFFLLKLAPDGRAEWFRTYGRARREWPYGMLRCSNGDLLLYGFTEDPAGAERERYALRVAPDGAIVWEHVGDTPGEDLILDALETPDGHFVLAASVEEDGQLLQLDADGNIRWMRRYELPGWQYASQVALLEDGGFLLAGFSMAAGPPRQADTWLARCAPTGELLWEKAFGDPAFDDYATSLLPLSDGTYLIGAIADGLLLSRVDGDGNVLWRQSPVVGGVHGAMALAELDDGYLVAGLIQLVGGRSYDAILLRTDGEGRVAQ